MNEEQRKKLEEMAKAHYKKTGGDEGFVMEDFMSGAQAAWEMATKAERERCARLVRDATAYEIYQRILNPPKGGADE